MKLPIDPFQDNGPFLYPLTTSENHFLIFAGDIERERGPEMG